MSFELELAQAWSATASSLDKPLLQIPRVSRLSSAILARRLSTRSPLAGLAFGYNSAGPSRPLAGIYYRCLPTFASSLRGCGNAQPRQPQGGALAQLSRLVAGTFPPSPAGTDCYISLQNPSRPRFISCRPTSSLSWISTRCARSSPAVCERPADIVGLQDRQGAEDEQLYISSSLLERIGFWIHAWQQPIAYFWSLVELQALSSAFVSMH